MNLKVWIILTYNDKISGSANPKTVLYKWEAIPKSYGVSNVMEYVNRIDQLSKFT